MLILLIYFLAFQPAWAGAEFSDEPVDEIIHPDWFKQSFLDLKEDVAEAEQANKDGIIVFFAQQQTQVSKPDILLDLIFHLLLV